jgi:hypothetical protein
MSSPPSTHRPRDRFYVFFLLSYIPTIILFDCQPLYPAWIIPTTLAETHDWYISFFGDPLISSQPAWFRFFTITELCYQLPMAIFLAHALWKKCPNAPLHALLWGFWCAGTTATCVYEFYYDTTMSLLQKQMLSAMYGSYGLICEFPEGMGMGIELMKCSNSCGDRGGYVLADPEDAFGGGGDGGGEEETVINYCGHNMKGRDMAGRRERIWTRSR